jgi:hypothetical protein
MTQIANTLHVDLSYFGICCSLVLGLPLAGLEVLPSMLEHYGAEWIAR